MAGWITIGKYHARVNLGKAWIHRKKVFPALGAGFVAYVVILYMLFDTYKEPILSLMGTPEGLEIAGFSAILSLIILAIWGYIIYINVLLGIRKRKRRDIQLLLSSPITYSDLLMGSFLAMLPSVAIGYAFLYAPIALAAGVVFDSGLVPIVKIGIALGETVILALIVSGIVLAIVEPIVDRLSRNRIALVVFIIIFIVIYSLFYVLPGEGIRGISDNVVYLYLPTTLAGNVVNEALVGSFGFKPNPSGGVSMLLLGLLTLAVFYAGFSSAGRFFTLEAGVATPTVTISEEGIVYRLLRRFRVGERVIFHSKVFFRNPKNVLQFGMMAAVVYVIPFFTLRTIPPEANTELPIIALVTSVMMIVFLAPFPALTVYALSKDAMWVWKSAPDGERSFLLTKWKQSLIVGLVYVPVPVIIGIWAKSPWDYMLFGMVLIIIILSSTTSIALFVSTYNPAYDVEGGKVALNLFIVIGIFIGIIVPPLYIMFGVLGMEMPSETGFFILALSLGILTNIIGAGLMRQSIRRLSKQE